MLFSSRSAPLLLLLLQLISAIRQPNVVLLLADDLGWGDVPWHDARTIAPNLKELASTGTIFDRYYVQPICTPTRGALMTGKYPSRIGLQHSIIGPDTPFGLPLNETILPEYMRKLGYSVHGIGKWHLGHCSWDHTPTKRGFDSFYGYFNGATDYYTKELGSLTGSSGFDFRYNTLENSGKVKDEVLWSTNTTYSSYLYTQQAKQVISSHDKSKPLFLYLPMQNPHFPAEVPTQYYDMYEGIVKDKTRRTLLAMVTALDDIVKSVVYTLKDSGLWENTVFIFFADNGGMLGRFSIGQINYPLRGGKATYWEGGIRSASFIHSPLLQGGNVNGELIHVTDWLPTITHIGACGVEPTNCTGPELGDIDGVNQWNTIIGESESPRSEFLVNYDQVDNNAALRMGKWKLLQGDPGRGPWVPPPAVNYRMYKENLLFAAAEEKGEDGWEYAMGGEPVSATSWRTKLDDKVQLYDVESDPYEKEEVSKDNPEVVQQMLARLQVHKDAAVPPANKPSDPEGNPDNFGGVWTPWLETC
ncbi:hypothetical protein ACHWQZ_G009712 [Mnemiopsis leidyi]